MTITPGALAVLLVWLGLCPAAFAQQVRVVTPQAPVAPALGQLGMMLQGSLTSSLSSPQGPSLSRTSIWSPSIRFAPGPLELPESAVAVGGAKIVAAPASALHTLPQGSGAQKLLILLERASQASQAAQASPMAAAAQPASESPAAALKDSPGASRPGARAVMARVAAELERMPAERLREMPREELNAWSARLLEGGAVHSKAEPVAPELPVSRSLKGGLKAAALGAAPAAEPRTDVSAPAPSEPPVPAEAKRAIKGFTLARIFSISVFALHQIAFAFMAIDAVGGGTFATVMMISGLASIPLAFVNGMLVDKLTPRQILVGGSALLAVASVVMGLLKAAGMITFATLLPLSIVTQFMLIAVIVGEASLIPKILKDAPHAIPRAFALFDLIFAGISALASVAGGLLVKTYLGYEGTFYLYAAVQALVVIPVYLWFMPKVQQALPRAPGFGEAIALLRRSPYLLGLLGLSFAAVLLVFPLRITLLPVIVKTFLHGTPAEQGFINTAVFLGMLGASLFNVTLAKKIANSRLLLGSSLAFAGFGLLLAFPTSMTAMLAGIAVVYLLQTVSENVLRGLYSQEAGKLHPEFVGRLMGIRSAMFGAAIAGGTWLIREAIGGAAYPALLWWLAPAYAAAILLYMAAPWILRWTYARTHPDAAGPKEFD